MKHKKWWRFATDHMGTLRLSLLLAVAGVLLVARPFHSATNRTHWSLATARSGTFLPRVYRPTGERARAIGEIVGHASVIDGDTIEISGTRIRLHGIDAPESAQTCMKGGQSYRCGLQATLALADLVRSHLVRCDPVSQDQYRRTVARCHTEDGKIDIGAQLVRQGVAVAYRRYSTEYLADEGYARFAGRGLWAGSFQMPGDYRAETAGEALRWSR
jgi:endonuclease YncB( thermonuclease family)